LQAATIQAIFHLDRHFEILVGALPHQDFKVAVSQAVAREETPYLLNLSAYKRTLDLQPELTVGHWN
jgi:hypothetical protein